MAQNSFFFSQFVVLMVTTNFEKIIALEDFEIWCDKNFPLSDVLLSMCLCVLSPPPRVMCL